MNMVRKLSDALRQFGLDGDSPVEVRADGDEIIIRPVRSLPEDEADKIVDEVLEDHAETLTKLAK